MTHSDAVSRAACQRGLHPRLSERPRKNRARRETQVRDQDDRFRVGLLGGARPGLRVSEGRGRFCAADWSAAAIASCDLNASSSLA